MLLFIVEELGPMNVVRLIELALRTAANDMGPRWEPNAETVTDSVIRVVGP